MKTYYVYYITFLPPSSDYNGPLHYIGVHSTTQTPRDDIGVRYFTSSKYVKSIFRRNPEQFRIAILSEHPTYKIALLEERRLLLEANVPHNPSYFNRAVWSESHIDVMWGEQVRENCKKAAQIWKQLPKWQKGNKIARKRLATDPIIAEKRSRSMKEQWSNGSRDYMRIPHTMEHSQNIANALRGKPKSAKHKHNMSKSRLGKPNGRKGISTMTTEGRLRIAESNRRRALAKKM